MEQNRALHLERFAQRLLAQERSAVLDVGCGKGALLERLRRAGRRAVGVEPAPTRALLLRAADLPLVAASAAALPFADASFAWVVLRHVLHHLASPADALREALRVARDGVLVAEPWNDPDLPSQRNMSEVDAWLRSRQRERGELHGPNLTLEQILAPLPLTAEACHVEHFAPLRPLGPQGLRELAREVLGDPLSVADAAELRRLEARARTGGITLPGTMIVTCPKR